MTTDIESVPSPRDEECRGLRVWSMLDKYLTAEKVSNGWRGYSRAGAGRPAAVLGVRAQLHVDFAAVVQPQGRVSSASCCGPAGTIYPCPAEILPGQSGDVAISWALVPIPLGTE